MDLRQKMQMTVTLTVQRTQTRERVGLCKVASKSDKGWLRCHRPISWARLMWHPHKQGLKIRELVFLYYFYEFLESSAKAEMH